MTSVGQTAFDLLLALPTDVGERWGDIAYPFQIEDAEAALMGDCPYSFLTRSRGSSKTTDMAGCALATVVTAPHRGRYYWLAADRDQGTLAIDAIAAFVSRTGALAGTIEVQTHRVINLRTGSSLQVVAADAASAWGTNPDGLFCDELSNWRDVPTSRRLWEAYSSAAAKRTGSRLAVFSTAGDPRHFSYPVLEHARSSSLWHVHEVAGPSPWISEDKLEEQRLRLPAAVYQQLFENLWVQAEGSFLDPGVVAAAFTLEGPALEAEVERSGFFGGLDLGHTRDRTAFAIVHRTEEGEVHLDCLRTWAPAKDAPVDFGEVEAFVIAAHRKFPFSLRADPWQGLAMIDRLREAGVPVQPFNFSTGSKQRLAATLLHSLNAGTLKLYPAPGLLEELRDLRVRQTATGWTFDHDARGHDDRAVALSLALVAAIEHPGWDASSHSALPGSAEDIRIERAGLSKTGLRYLDVGDDGELHPPPGWERRDEPPSR